MVRLTTAFLLTILAGQASALSLAGKWDCEGRDGSGAALHSVQEYHANGTFAHRIILAFGDRTGNLDAELATQGDWSLETGRILETYHLAGVTAIRRDGEDVSLTPMGKQMTRNLPKLLMRPDRANGTSIREISPDRFEIVGSLNGFCQRR